LYSRTRLSVDGRGLIDAITHINIIKLQNTKTVKWKFANKTHTQNHLESADLYSAFMTAVFSVKNEE